MKKKWKREEEKWKTHLQEDGGREKKKKGEDEKGFGESDGFLMMMQK